MVVPRFVLNELQHIADSPDALRRNRGRRGLDILSKLQKESLVPIEMIDADANGADVDSKLVKMAKQQGCAILTNDYNLNRVAALQGVRVLNINELANALKAVVLPGEEISVRVIQEGKELGQGVGYLDDGTMVVVEGGRRYLGSQMAVVRDPRAPDGGRPDDLRASRRTSAMAVGAIVVGAGASRRAGFDKVLAPLAGRPVLAHSVAVFESCDAVDRIVVVLSRHQPGEWA